MPTLAVAALSARTMAEAARQGGFDVVALDLFGDPDTRRACAEWRPIGTSKPLRIDAEQTLAALRALALRGDVAGWVAGSGFDGLPALLEQGAEVLPLIGTAAHAVRRVRDPTAFFGFLESSRIGHPATRFSAPPDGTGWLWKNASGTGGWHIRQCPLRPEIQLPGGGYFQRRVPGRAMSASFIANGRDACVLGFNEQIVRSAGAHPFVFCGVVGPVPLGDAVARDLTRALRLLAAEFSLCGLGSLDFMLDGDAVALLEINPRPSASMALYAQSLPRGVMAAHVRACRHAELPTPTRTQPPVQGNEIVFARARIALDGAAAARLADLTFCHDLPAADSVFDADEPVCSVSAAGADPAAVRTQLSQRREAILTTLETLA